MNSDDTKNMRKSIKHGNKRKSTEIPELFSVEADGTNKVLALGADFDKWNYGDEICGKLFQDKTSGRYFAFMIHSPEEQAIFQRIPQRKLKDLFPNHKFSSVQETKLMFEMKEFLKVTWNWSDNGKLFILPNDVYSENISMWNWLHSGENSRRRSPWKSRGWRGNKGKHSGEFNSFSHFICRTTISWLASVTRQSSCVNARGIPPAAYQVLHLLSYPVGGVPHPWLGGGVLHLWRGVGYPILKWGCPIPGWGGGTPSLEGGRVPYPGMGVSHPWPGYPSPNPDLAGVPSPPPPHSVWTGWKHYLPHPSDAGGKNIYSEKRKPIAMAVPTFMRRGFKWPRSWTKTARWSTWVTSYQKLGTTRSSVVSSVQMLYHWYVNTRKFITCQ